MGNQKTYPLLPLVSEFISATKRNKRGKSSGKKITKDSAKNYEYLFKLLESFSVEENFELNIKPISGKNAREFQSQRAYYKKLYDRFTNYLYGKGHYDNYVGTNIKMLKAVFAWLNDEKGINTGPFFKNFHVCKEHIQIIVLSPEQLNYLINNQEFDKKLSPKLRRVRDIFVFGCTVALRFSDLMALKRTNLEILNGNTYLKVVSKKTQTFTRVKLPEYAIDIIRRNNRRGSFILPRLANVNLNKYIKELGELAGWTHTYEKLREIQGRPVTVYKNAKKREHYRFCDLITTHTMRRTTITTMLHLGMDESSVRRISGHAPGSQEFYKYVKYSQSLLDEKTDEVFQKLQQKLSKIA